MEASVPSYPEVDSHSGVPAMLERALTERAPAAALGPAALAQAAPRTLASNGLTVTTQGRAGNQTRLPMPNVKPVG